MPDNATLKSQYLAQIQADLERIANEKQRIANELTALQEQLTSLEHDHALLVGVQQTLAGEPSALPKNTGPAAAETPGVPKAAVPTPRKPKSAARSSRRATRTSQTAAGHSTAASSPAPASTLVGLVVADLTGRSEPRSAAEVTTALAQAHPDRKIQTTVVRNTLEALVAKGQALRSKQGRSVYYSATADPAVSASTSDVAEAAEVAA